jgi:xanthine dehydrogenase YagS FAD-binding subunit
MQPFDLVTPAGVAEAIELGAAPGAVYLAGGTNVVDFLRTGAMSARPLRDNTFKIELGTRAIVRALRQAGGGG